MKIAILFSGRILRYREHYDNIQTSLVQGHDAHFFLSHSPELDEDLAGFQALYAPKKINNGPIDYPCVASYTCHPQSNSHNMMCMWYNRHRVFQDMCAYMKETDTWYDLVISARLDMFSDESLVYDWFQDLDARLPPTVFVPEGYDWGGLNDQLAVGDFYAMETYMTLMDHIYPILDRLHPYYGPEPVLLKHLSMQGVQVVRFPFKYRLFNGKLFR